MADCKEYLNQISELIDGELSESQEAELNAHVESCPSCQRVYDAFIGISRAIPDELAEPPANFAEGVMQIINPKEEEKKSKKIHVWRYLAAAACFALVCIGAWSQGLFTPVRTGGSDVNNPRIAPAQLEDTFNSGSLELNLDIEFTEGGGTAPEESKYEPTEPDTTLEAPSGSVTQFGLQKELLNSSFASNRAFVESERTRLFGAESIAIYKGEYIPGDEKYADSVAAVENLDSKGREELLALMTDDTLLEYNAEAEEGLEPYCTLIFTGVKTAEGQSYEDIAVTVWIVSDWLVFKIDGETPILFLSETLPIDFEGFMEKLRIQNPPR